MTTKITLTYGDAELVVTGEYIKAERARFNPMTGIGSPGCPSGFEIERVEQDGHDVTEHYRQFRVIPLLEEMAREVVEAD